MKKKLVHCAVRRGLLICSLLFFSCSDLSHTDVATDDDSGTVVIPDEEYIEGYTEDDRIELGDERQNPYDIENMQKAYSILTQSDILEIARNKPEEPHITDIYFRVLPTDSIEFENILSDTSICYFGLPMDRDIVHNGSYYKDESADDPYTWQYAVVSETQKLPEFGKVDILNYLYIPVENEDVEDGEIDGIGVLEYVAYKLTYNLSEWENEDIIYYEELLKAHDLADIGGEEPTDEQLKSSVRGKSNAKKRWLSKAYPSGYFTVRNTYTGNLDGINGAQVILHNFIKVYRGTLDEHGHYKSTKPFRTKVHYWIRFYNVPTQTSIFPNVPLAGSKLHPLKKHSKEGFDYPCETNSVAWRYATINNALMKNMYFNSEYEIPTAYGLRIWVLPQPKDEEWLGSTPLLHYANGGWCTTAEMLVALLVGNMPSILLTPDMFIFSNQDVNSSTIELSQTIYHELSHVGHYLAVGDNYWDHYITFIINESGYGNDDSHQYAGYCGVGEMWGYYSGAFYTAKDIGIPSLDKIYYTSDTSWFNPNIMIEVGNYAIEKGFTYTDLYKTLNPEVHSLDAFRGQWIRMGLDEGTIDRIINERKGWER